MSSTKIHNYFKRKSGEWSLLGFLNESDEEQFRLKIDLYLRSLENIINYDEGDRKEKAQFLLDKYRKASKNVFCWKYRCDQLVDPALVPLGHRQPTSLPDVQRTRPDHQIAKNLKMERRSNKMRDVPSINISVSAQNIGIFNDSNFSVKKAREEEIVFRKRKQACYTESPILTEAETNSDSDYEKIENVDIRLIREKSSHKDFISSERKDATDILHKKRRRTISHDNQDSDIDIISDDEMLSFAKVTDSMVASKLAKISKEWETFKNAFSQVEDEIISKISPPLNKVENILKVNQEALEKAMNGGYIELDAVFLIYHYQNGFKFLERLVGKMGRQCLSEIELSKLPMERRSVGWFHDGILTINVNGVDECVGILEVVGNAINEDHDKMINDREKILKAMRLALFQLEETLRHNGVNDEQKLKQLLETFGILVDRRDFIFYAMHYYEEAYFVDEIALSFVIPNTPMQLFLLKDVIKKLLKFRARIEYLKTRITALLEDATSRRRPRWTTTVVDASPSTSKTRKKVPLKIEVNLGYVIIKGFHHGSVSFIKMIFKK
ncbi:6452_t:CDS:10 [Ambispora gerdemannii]|uniref:6452_t:CDS:1 n=1 Tax=Ambispora gerdemannii TaxID=144530 RepID=A0A9N9C4W7_9GLOM|nr:6452_t:CDS:10 [Ambispora gerdemannii]